MYTTDARVRRTWKEPDNSPERIESITGTRSVAVHTGPITYSWKAASKYSQPPRELCSRRYKMARDWMAREALSTPLPSRQNGWRTCRIRDIALIRVVGGDGQDDDRK